MYLEDYEEMIKDPYMILYNPIFDIHLDFIGNNWWFMDLPANYGIEGYYQYWPICIYNPTEEEYESDKWTLTPKYTS